MMGPLMKSSIPFCRFVEVSDGSHDDIGDAANFCNGRIRVFRKLSDFIRHDGEPPAAFAGTSGFNGGVQCEQVRLFP